MEVRDPGGHVRGVIEGAFCPRKALGIALGLRGGDRLMMVGEGLTGWSLVVFRPGAPCKAVPLGPRAGALSREAREVAESGLIDEAWQDLVDEGWSADRQNPRE